MIQNLGTFLKLCIILTIRDKEIQKPVVIVISPSSPPSSARHQVRYADVIRHIGEGAILVVPEKIVGSFSNRVTSRIDYIEIQIAIVIKISPRGRAVVAKAS